ncbi:hypothetical protein ACIGBL_33365 [Streptomyces sp. NPDC085614]
MIYIEGEDGRPAVLHVGEPVIVGRGPDGTLVAELPWEVEELEHG